MAIVVHFIHVTAYEQTQLNRVCYFHFFDTYLGSKGSDLTIKNLFFKHADASNAF